jgi:hypothetical protein
LFREGTKKLNAQYARIEFQLITRSGNPDMPMMKEAVDKDQSALTQFLEENWKAFYESSICPEPLMGGIG